MEVLQGAENIAYEARDILLQVWILTSVATVVSNTGRQGNECKWLEALQEYS